MNTLTLCKCAYIFDNTSGRFFYGTKEERERRNAVQKTLKEFYDNEQKRLEKIPYTKDDSDNIIIMLNGQPHRLNDLQIAHIDGEPENVINHRRNIDPAAVLEKAPHFHSFTKDSLYSNKFRTLNFEFFTGGDTLGYIRVHFNGNSDRFIIDDRTGELYTSGEHGRHERTTAMKICHRLGIESEAAKKEFFEVITAITEH